jgi:hypothetical protein
MVGVVKTVAGAVIVISVAVAVIVIIIAWLL